MAKKKKHEEHENLERWLVSYADFITLLFATFVILYALSQLDLAKFKLLKVSLNEAFTPTIFSGKQDTILTNQGDKLLNESKQGDDVNILPPINPNLEEKKMEEAKKEVEEEIVKEKIEGVSVKIDKRGLIISLVDSIFFDPGSAFLKSGALEALNKVAGVIKKKFPGYHIRIEGHTDSLPISSAVFPSNWELSASRASSVVRHFISKFSIDKDLFSAVGYADTVPIAPNNIESGRKKNRRVEIVILNSKTTEAEAKAPNNFADKPAEPIKNNKKNTEQSGSVEIFSGDKTEGKSIDFDKLENNQENTPEKTDHSGQINQPAENKTEHKDNAKSEKQTSEDIIKNITTSKSH